MKTKTKKLYTETEVKKIVNTIMEVHMAEILACQDEIDRLQRLIDFYHPSSYADGC